MIISATPVFKPRRLRTCAGMCGLPIRFDCVRLYGAAWRGDPPYTIYICHDCAALTARDDLKVKAAVERLEAA